jgi:hypothetical protein
MNTLKRLFVFLATESIVQFATAYNGYLYGLSYFLNSAFVGVFSPEDSGYHTKGIGLCFLVIVVETIIGPITKALFQEPYFKRQVDYKNIPEGKLMLLKFAAVAFPISLFLFAWTSYTDLASGLWAGSITVFIFTTYTYAEDSHKVCSDSPVPLSCP